MTKIEWTDEVWNVVTGCTHSGMPGCDNCYARRLFPRVYGKLCEVCEGAGAVHDEDHGGAVRCPACDGRPSRKFDDVETHPDRLDKPLHWRKPRRVFVCSMGDLFHEDVPFEFIDDVWHTMREAHWHTFQVLTKHPERMREYLTEHWRNYLVPYPNVWLGASASTQADLERVMRDLVHVPAAVRSLSLEPLLRAVDLTRVGGDGRTHWDNALNGCLSVVGTHLNGRQKVTVEITEPPRPRLDWVIVGCESGPKRRPSPPEWTHSIIEQCRGAGVAVFHKQMDIDGRVSKDMGEWPEWARIRQLPVVS